MNASSVFRLALALGIATPAGAVDIDAAARLAVDDAVLGAIEGRSAEEAVELRQPQRIRRELGAVVDAHPADGGLPRVLAVTPAGAADRMGLLAGDRLLGANGSALGADAGERLRALLDGERRIVEFEIQRGGEQLRVSGPLDEVVVPGYQLRIEPVIRAAASGCGRISTLLKPPPSQSLFPALLHEVDGHLPGPLDSEVFRVDAGHHVLKVSELIDPNRFNQVENRKRSQLFRHERFKYLEIDVQPGTTYRLGVRFHPDRRDPIRDGAYWEPVIWGEIHESCR